MPGDWRRTLQELRSLRRAGSFAEAAKSYERALALVVNDNERRFLEQRLREVLTPQ